MNIYQQSTTESESEVDFSVIYKNGDPRRSIPNLEGASVFQIGAKQRIFLDNRSTSLDKIKQVSQIMNLKANKELYDLTLGLDVKDQQIDLVKGIEEHNFFSFNMIQGFWFEKELYFKQYLYPYLNNHLKATDKIGLVTDLFHVFMKSLSNDESWFNYRYQGTDYTIVFRNIKIIHCWLAWGALCFCTCWC